MKQKILGTGLSGLIGSRLIELLEDKYDFEDLSYDTGVDITKPDLVEKRVKESSASWLIHLAAKADVDGCEQDKAAGENGAAWKINVLGTQNVISAARKTNKRVLYISTDFVFDGTKDEYTEEDTPQPVNWYARTKYEGEKLTLAHPENLVVRIAYPYRAKNSVKKDFVHAILGRLQEKKPIAGITDHVVTPTYIDDIAHAFDLLIAKNERGVYHVVGGSYCTPFEASKQIAQVFGLDETLITETTRAEYYRGKAARPFQLRMKNAKIRGLGLEPKTFLDGLESIKAQGVEG